MDTTEKPVETRLEKLVDGALGLVSPRRVLFRRHFRRLDRDADYRKTFHALMRARGYRMARTTDQSTPFRGSAGSADRELSADLPTMRNRSRELCRDNPIASGLVGTFQRNVAGTGVYPHATTDDDQRNTNFEAIWTERADSLYPAEQLDQAAAQRLLVGKYLTDGDIGIKAAKRAPDDPVWFELDEAERVAAPLNPTEAGNREIRDGVEKDAYGIPVAYWVCKKHPGDGFVTAFNRDDFIRVAPANFKLWGRKSRPGQTRGEPAFHAIGQDLMDLDVLLLASQKRMIVSACLAAFIKTAGSVENIVGTLVDKTAAKEGYQLEQDLVPGMIYKLLPGDEIQTVLPNFPSPELGPFIIMLCRRIGAALGVSWQVVLKDFGDSTFSSARTDLVESRQPFIVVRAGLASVVLTWQWVHVLTDAQLRGDPRLAGVPASEFTRVKWYGQGWRYIDPSKDVPSWILALEANIATLEEVWAEKGQHWRTALKQRAVEKKELASLGLTEVEALPGAAPNDGNQDEGSADGDTNSNGNGRGVNGHRRRRLTVDERYGARPLLRALLEAGDGDGHKDR